MLMAVFTSGVTYLLKICMCDIQGVPKNPKTIEITYPRADGAKRRSRVLIPPGYLHPGKRKH